MRRLFHPAYDWVYVCYDSRNPFDGLVGGPLREARPPPIFVHLLNQTTTNMFHSSLSALSRLSLPVLAALSFTFTACNKDLEEARPTAPPAAAANSNARTGGMSNINMLLKTAPTPALLAELGTFGTVTDVLPEINAVILKAQADKLTAIRQLAYVQQAAADGQMKITPVETAAAPHFAGGVNTWDLDAINVTDQGQGRVVAADGTGVFVGVLDTGLLDNWRQYFSPERVATQYAKSFNGDVGTISEQPNKWEHDQNGHGTHVASTILGYNYNGVAVNGVAPKATIIPVKVLNQNGLGSASGIARGILYFAQLKMGPLKNVPLVVNMSVGGPDFDGVMQAAVNYAISKGVVLVASAGNEGAAGMLYPAAYTPVISVGSVTWNKQAQVPDWWFASDVAEPTDVNDFRPSSYSSRALPGQDLDVTAPGNRIYGPYQTNSGPVGYAVMSGTSMASPHVAGIVALMAQRNPGLGQHQVESLLENAAVDVAPAGKDNATGAGFITADKALGLVQ
jgi:subtilisin family serine protease